MMQRFTDDAQRVLSLAQEAALELGHDYVGTEHVLIGLTKVKNGVAAKALEELGLVTEDIFEAVEEHVGRGNKKATSIYMTPRVKHVLELAIQVANQMNHNYVGTEHILLGLLSDGSGVAVAILRAMNIRSNDVVEAIRSILGSNKGSNNGGQEGINSNNDLGELSDFATDLNESAKQGKIDPVIGRDTEIQRVIQILSRRTKNNPVLIGEPGVGKTAIAEGLAQRIVTGNVPEILRNKRIISLSIGSMLAGAKYRGEFEERLKKAIDEVQQHDDMIIFIDEIHTLVGAGATEGAMDAANILKPALARGEFQVIGATTLDEYKKHIEKDAALERRFQPVQVGEPNEEDALEILKGLRDRYEAFHKAKITDEALTAAVSLSSRYITDRFLPDKAIDVVDEAASKVRMKVFSAAPDVKALEDRLNTVKKEKEAAVTSQDFEKAAELRDEEQSLLKEIGDKKSIAKEKSDQKLIVTEEDIAAVVAQWTGIPVAKIAEEESATLLHLEEELHKRVVGQDEAVTAVAKAVRRARAGLKDPKRPIGSFLFLGPTGVGKTELARALASSLFGDESAMIRLDMSEYMEKHTVSRLVGAGAKALHKNSPELGFLAAKKSDSNVDENKGIDFKEAKKSVMDAVKRHFRPEFLNRIDEMIVFHPLTEEDLKEIVTILMSDVTKRLEERDLQLEISPEAMQLLVKEGSDFTMGARPLKRAIQRLIEDPVSDLILKGDAKEGKIIKADAKDNDLVVSI
ncbi:MAG: ATP-dependent Clp protease ATP-binding subunit [Veillonella sp.]|nr:ATP-dependent Clp protease ATP-binding subunit [Veillonella sp.]